MRDAFKNLQRNSQMARNNKQRGASYAQRKTHHASQFYRVNVDSYGYTGVSPALNQGS